jgi:micrococcal nuclease
MRQFLFAAFLVLLVSTTVQAKDYIVKKVIDGDTVLMESGETVKYIGVDAPYLYKKEGAEFYAKEAARFNKKLVLLKKVRLEFDTEKKDSKGRILAYVFVKNVFVNNELVKLGYAKAAIKPPNTKYQAMLLSAQQKAMAEERGLWQERKKDSEAHYVGNKRTYTLHRPSCPLVSKIPEKSRITFRSRADAIKIGYSLCKKCKP